MYVQHREPWQQVGSILTSKAQLSSFALELMKKMKIRYHAPPMPVELTVRNPGGFGMQLPDFEPRGRVDTYTDDNQSQTIDIEAVEAMFKR